MLLRHSCAAGYQGGSEAHGTLLVLHEAPDAPVTDSAKKAPPPSPHHRVQEATPTVDAPPGLFSVEDEASSGSRQDLIEFVEWVSCVDARELMSL
jgi:hypothetical protein